MRRGRIFFYLAFIVILVLVLVYILGQKYLNPAATPDVAQPEPTPQILTVEVIFAIQRISRGTPINGDVLGKISIPQELFYEGLFTSVDDVVGKLAKFDLEAGTPISQGMLANRAEELSGTGSNAALAIPRGMVAVSVPINRLSSVSYAPRAGDHVNVLVAVQFVDLDTDFQTLLPNKTSNITPPIAGIEGEVPSIVAVTSGGGDVVGKTVIDPVLEQNFYVVPSEEVQRPRLVSQNILQDIVVLHVGEFPSEEEEKKAQATEEPAVQQDQVQPQAQVDEAPGTPPPDVITLIVTPQDAIMLNYVLYSGAQISLALRSAGDDTRVGTDAVTLQYLLEQYNIPVPAKLPNGIEDIQDIVQSSPTPQP